MERLPRALQNEIYEFARGDRKYWRERFGDIRRRSPFRFARSRPFEFNPIVFLHDIQNYRALLKRNRLRNFEWQTRELRKQGYQSQFLVILLIFLLAWFGTMAWLIK